MTMTTIVEYCRQTDSIFVEEYQVAGETRYVFLDYHGHRVYLTTAEIVNRLRNTSLTSGR